MIIGITGKKGTGKDTIADILVQYHNFTKFSFADKLKNVCDELFDLPKGSTKKMNQEQKESIINGYDISYREFLQKFGTDFIRNNIDKDFWVKNIHNKIKNRKDNIVISDVRFPNEATMIKNVGGVIFFVERDIIHTDNHESENNKIESCSTIYNNGTIRELREHVVDVISNTFHLTNKNEAFKI